MCTTYLGAVLLERLESVPMKLETYPELIRLNPNVPWKTRGNGAICLRYEGPPYLSERIETVCTAVIEELSVMEDPQTNPGMALATGDIPDRLVSFYRKALHRIVSVEEAEKTAYDSGAVSYTHLTLPTTPYV
jgi:tRNA(Ile2)-agmatinylcytidine synthase